MYNEELEMLIDAALADGELTEKEKQVLFKKAQALGVDLDEFEMVLDARLVKLKQKQEEETKTSAPKSNKYGDVKKCPACGAIVQGYQGSCPECGYAFEGIDANTAAKELATLLRQATSHEKMKIIIDTFPLPIDKSALISFTTWLRPQSLDMGNPLRKSYWKKYQECIQKAQISFPNDETFATIITEYNSDKKKFRQGSIINNWKDIIVCLIKPRNVIKVAISIIIFFWLLLLFL